MKPYIQFENRVCLVTGAGSETGIGFATAKILGELGGTVLIVSTTNRIFNRENELKSSGINAKGYVCDLMNRETVNDLIKSIVSEYGRIDVLVNNAGMVQTGIEEESSSNFADIKDEEWDISIARNLNICYNVTHAVIPHMINARYGRIVNVSSVTGPLVSNPGSAAYSAAKAAVVGMSRSIAIEVAKQNITVNNVLPGWIATGSQTPEEAVAALNTPAGRGGTPEEVGHMIVFLASEKASYITGQQFVVDGGNILQEYKGPSELYY